MTSPDAHYLPAGGAARAAWLEDELVVAVDRDDNEMGLISRGVAHEYDGVLHRAFMVLLTDEKGRFLLARRSNHKRLWPGVWADSCAGHPRPAEDTVKAARRRVHEELGCEADIIRVGSFVYRTTYPGRGCEHELCHVMVGRAIGDFQPDPAEVAGVRAFRQDQLVADMEKWPNLFAPWLVECVRTLLFDDMIVGSSSASPVVAMPIELDPWPSTAVR